MSSQPCEAFYVIRIRGYGKVSHSGGNVEIGPNYCRDRWIRCRVGKESPTI